MGSNQNKYSIILPVHNGGNYIKECVSSILNQTLQDFNLIILENNSNDGTLEWLQSLKDERIIVHDSPNRTLTIEENWGRALKITKNEFITLIGHDDILMPDYLETMENLIAKHPNASLYQTHFTYINSEGQIIKQCQPMDEIQSPIDFTCHFLCNKIDTMGTGFMMRAADYDSIGGIPLNYPNLLFADFDLWIRLTQISYKATAFNCSFSFRIHQSTTTKSADDKFQRAFEIFLDFLFQLKQESKIYSEAIERYGKGFIDFYAKGLSHRLLRTPKRLRKNNSTVSNFLDMCKKNAILLIPDEEYNPSKRFSVKLAIFIDKYLITRSLFLLFKSIYKKPLYD